MRHWLRFQWLIYLRCDKWNLTSREALSGVSLRRWWSSRPELSDSPGLTHRIRRCLDEQSACSPTQTPKHNKHTHTNSHVNTPSCLLHLHCSMNLWTHTRAHITHLCQGPHTPKRTHKESCSWTMRRIYTLTQALWPVFAFKEAFGTFDRDS